MLHRRRHQLIDIELLLERFFIKEKNLVVLLQQLVVSHLHVSIKAYLGFFHVPLD